MSLCCNLLWEFVKHKISSKLDPVDTDKPGQFSALKEAIKQEGPLAKTPQQTILLNYKTLSRTSSLLAFVSTYAF